MVNLNLINKKAKAFILDEKRIEVNKWNEILFKVFDILYEKNKDELFELAKQNKIRGRDNIYLSTDSQKITGTPHEIKPGLFIEKKFNATFIVETCVKFLSAFGYENFKIETDDGSLYSVIPPINEPIKLPSENNYFVLRTGGNYPDIPREKYIFKSGIPGYNQLKNAENKGKFVYLENGKFYAVGDIGRIDVEEKEGITNYTLQVLNFQNIPPVNYESIKQKIGLTLNIEGIRKITKEQFDRIIEKTNTDTIKYWQIAPGEQAKDWGFCLKEGIIPIYFVEYLKDAPDEILTFTKEQLRSYFSKKYPQSTNASLDLIWRFINEVQIGDNILTNKGQKVVLGWGVIKSVPKIFKGNSDITLYREVDWKDSKLNKEIDPEIGRHFFKTIYQMTRNQFESVVNPKMYSGNQENPQFSKIQKVLDYKKQVILYGPPGTGKTWVASNFIKSKSTPEINSGKIRKNKKFFWYTISIDSGTNLRDYLENQEIGIDDELGVDGNISNAYEEIEEGDIVIIYNIQESRFIGISSCSGKNPPTESGIWDIILRYIKQLQGPLWGIIEKDQILQNSEPVKYYESSKLSPRSDEPVLDPQPYPQHRLWNTMFHLTQEEGMRLLELAQVSLNDADKSPENDIKVITTDKKFFWYPTKSMKLNPLDSSLSELFTRGEEGVIWFGRLRSAFDEILEGDILIFYVRSQDLSWIATCSRKEVPQDGNSKIFVRGIKHFQGPALRVIKNDALLKAALPMKQGDFGVLHPLTREVVFRFLELAQVSLKDLIGEGTITKVINRDFNEERTEKTSLCNFVTFHPSYAYEEFIEGLRPIADDEGNICYEIQEGIFKRASREALNAILKVAEIDREWYDYSPVPKFSLEEREKIKKVIDRVPFYLVIDEINRGDISRIFGELITLIEFDKRLFCENEITLELPYSKMEFGIPPNLFIIGTMNTADRSISLMDIALRRRFGFIELIPDYDVLTMKLLLDRDLSNEVKEYRNLAIQSLKTVNEKLTEKYDRDHQIGHSYIMKLSKVTSNEDTIEILTNIWRYEIIPLLQEYFYDSPEKLLYITNNRFFEKSGSSFILKSEDDIIAALYAIKGAK